MKYLVDVERPVFLHFLNREAASAIGVFPAEENDILAINVLTICHCSKLSVNISQMIEYSHDKPRLTKLLSALTKGEILIITSNDTNLDEFIRTRQILYDYVPDRYPMYFKDTSLIRDFQIRQNNSFSMTTLLRRDILNIDSNQLSLYARRARTQDLERFRSSLDAIQRITFRETHQAITKANFALFSKEEKIPPPALDSTGRVFSALYFEHYSENNLVATPTGLLNSGYIEDADYFPHYDIPILKNALHYLGWAELKITAAELRAQLIAAYGSPEHRIFVETINAFLHACSAQVQKYIRPKKKENGEIINTAREVITNLSCHLIRKERDERSSTPTDIIDFFKIATDIIWLAARAQSKTEDVFRRAWEVNMPPKPRIRILFLTATDVEDDAIANALSNSGFKRDGYRDAGQDYATRYISGSKKEIFHVRSSAGSVGSSGSELVCADAIRVLGPNFVISVGICFGLREDSSKIGDILISEEVLDYEKVRVGEDELRERGHRIPAGSKLLSAARQIRSSYSSSPTDVKLGLLISGLKLVDSELERTNLKTRFRDALGGEMEASGIMGAATRTGQEWIIIKAICDWAANKGKGNQQLAAENASAYAVKVAKHVMDIESTIVGQEMGPAAIAGTGNAQ